MKSKIFIGLAICAIGVFSWLTIDGWATERKSSTEYSNTIGKEFREGDIIFQKSQSRQCAAIKLATGSALTHCGILFKEKGQWLVLEAVQPVKYTPFNDWIKRGQGNEYFVKRLKNADTQITPEVIKKMKDIGAKMLNKDYDLTFEWNDDRIYCSELVWKIYERVLKIEVGKTQHLKDLDLSAPIVKEIMQERYGDNIPFEEIVISPAAIFDSELLEEVR